MRVQAHEEIVVDDHSSRGRSRYELRPIPNRYRASAPHLGRSRLLDVDNLRDGSSAAKFPENVINTVHVDEYNIIRVRMST